jgi:hypothetical protein
VQISNKAIPLPATPYRLAHDIPSPRSIRCPQPFAHGFQIAVFNTVPRFLVTIPNAKLSAVVYHYRDFVIYEA